MPDTTADSSISHRTWCHVVWAVFAVVVAIQFLRVCTSPRGDFDVHWESGRRIANGKSLYAAVPDGDPQGHNYPYPPFWAVVHAPLSVIPVRAAQALIYPLFVVSAVVLLRVLRDVSRPHWQLSENAEFWVMAAALLLSSRFLIRDMPECGVNLALVALSWSAFLCWMRGREWLGGGFLGLATSLKCTPALFLAWFLWKRQWKMVGTTLTMIAVCTVSPILIMGPSAYSDAVSTWVGNAWRGIGETDPSYGVLGAETVQNMALRPALARILIQLPAEHPLRVDHPAYVDVFAMSPQAAGVLIKVLMVALLVGIAWCFRHRVDDRTDLALLWEASAVSLLILLLSPITWGQHCVGVLPMMYLVARRYAGEGTLPRTTLVALGVYIGFILVLNRTVLGLEWTYLLDSYHVTTWCLLLLTGAAAAMRCEVAAAPSLERRDAPAEPVGLNVPYATPS